MIISKLHLHKLQINPKFGQDKLIYLTIFILSLGSFILSNLEFEQDKLEICCTYLLQNIYPKFGQLCLAQSREWAPNSRLSPKLAIASLGKYNLEIVQIGSLGLTTILQYENISNQLLQTESKWLVSPSSSRQQGQLESIC